MRPELKGLKVLHLIDSGGLYGAEKMLLALAKEQIRQGFEPMILSAGEHGVNEKPLEAEAKRLNIPVMPFRMKPGLNFKQAWKILRWAREQRYQLLHSHGFKFNVLLGMFPRNISRIPIVTTLHGYVHAPRFSNLWLYQQVDQLAIRRMKGVVLVGAAMKKEFPGKLSSGHAVVIPNGLDLSALEMSSLALMDEPFKSFFASHEPVILGIGRLSKEKGFDRLISAFSEFKKDFPRSGLVIVGEGGCRQQLEELVSQLSVEEDVLMPGYCSYVPVLLRHSQALVMPSLSEGLPITLLEAMSLKVPVVASAVGEIPRVLSDGEGGTLLGNIEPDTISKAIKNIIANKTNSCRQIKISHEVVNKKYSSVAMSRNYLEFYKKVLAF
ncbi:glycosyltransferase [Marinobacter halotolerans]|uniref:glycosyltransferase n=1 Tax=Marinobacter halotolerans TaxID=1569211 RepID=UPI00177E1CD9|nr:glycosyltransferase [Marinobacter halotolerans]